MEKSTSGNEVLRKTYEGGSRRAYETAGKRGKSMVHPQRENMDGLEGRKRRGTKNSNIHRAVLGTDNRP